MGATDYINKLRAKLCSKIALKRSSEEAIGYFAYTRAGEVCCDGDACIISGSEKQMEFYLQEMGGDIDQDIIEQTYFEEVMSGIKNGGAYAFDKEAYDSFFGIAELKGIYGLPPKELFLEYPEEKMNLVRVQFFGT